MASLSLSPQEREQVDRLRHEIVEPSRDAVVLVRFTASWCGPCRQLAPLVEKAIAEAGDPRLREVVVDIDANPLIAGQFQIQSVPTVYAVVNGQPVDGFVGAQSASQLRAFIEKQLARLPKADGETDFDALVEAALHALDEGDASLAADALGAMVREHPDRHDIIGGYARALLALGQAEGAEAALATVPPDSADDQVAKARAQLELARALGPAGDAAGLEARLQADPNDHEARYELAGALFAKGERDAAADQLFAIIAADPAWNEGAARARLLKFFEAAGLGDPWSVATRRRLSQLIFS
ncbi:MAG: tetratricopeptide repeat protein [Thermaurantiacus sp.]